MGLLVGAISGSVFSLAHGLWGAGPAAALALILAVVMTGAFHEDGLADVCDGFGGGYTPERVLEIMKDSRVGAFGAIGSVLSLLLQWTLVANLAPAGGEAVLALICAHALSRALALSVCLRLPYRRDTGPGLAKPVASGLQPQQVWAGLLIGGLPVGVYALAFSALRAGLAVLLAVLLAEVLVRWFRRRIGGYTGDCLGATQQIGFIALLLGLSAQV